jgi:hypothetical protein
MALPLPLRNRLAQLILDALSDRAARQGLAALVAACDDPRAPEAAEGLPESFADDLFERRGSRRGPRRGFAAHAAELCARARRGWFVVRERPLAAPDPPLETALAEAAALFDAGLFFEVHEHLEPRWFRASGRDREALQGLIQVAVGFQHLANGNVVGARRLLAEGTPRLRGRLARLDLDRFSQGLDACRERLNALDSAGGPPFDWTTVPPFPRGAGA